MDNVQLNSPTTSGAIIATDDLAGIQHQLVKIEFGGDSVATMVSAADPLPTTDAAVLAKLSADPSTETTLAALLAKVIAAPSTEAKQDATNVLLATIAAITQPLTDAELRATPLPVSGTINTGLTQPLTDAQLRATPISVSGAVTVDTSLLSKEAKQDIGNASLASIDAKITNPLPVSGTVTVDTSLLATSDKQDTQTTLITTLNSLIETNNYLINLLSPLAAAMNSGQPALRVAPISSVSTAVTGSVTATVASTVVSSLTNFGTGIPATEMANDINNFTVTLANINNVTV